MWVSWGVRGVGGGLEGDEREMDVSAVWRPADLSCESEQEESGDGASRLMRPSAGRPPLTSCPHIVKIHALSRQRPSSPTLPTAPWVTSQQCGCPPPQPLRVEEKLHRLQRLEVCLEASLVLEPSV